MRRLRLFIKKQFPHVYQYVRSLLFPLYQKATQKRRQSFANKQIVEVNYAGQHFLIALDPANGFVDTEIYTAGVYEPDILSYIKTHLPVGGTFVDIGSNIGQHALFAASVVGATGTVVAFEPIPSLVAQLKESIKRNNFQSIVTLYPNACSNTKATTSIKLKPGNIGGSGIHHANNTFKSVEITTVLADTYTTLLSKIDLIKIDTEGHEIEALKGLVQSLLLHRPKMIIEFSPSLREDSHHYSHEFFTIMKECSYDCFDIENGERQIHDTEQFISTFTKAQTNILCLPK